jgi:hypothetical protein
VKLNMLPSSPSVAVVNSVTPATGYAKSVFTVAGEIHCFSTVTSPFLTFYTNAL